MNVKELIKELERFDSNLPVACGDNEMGEYEISIVELDEVSSGNLIYFYGNMEAGDNMVILR